MTEVPPPQAETERDAKHAGREGFALVALGACALLGAAAFNGYPLTFWDTRAYLEHAFTLLPRPDRLIGYSLLLRALGGGASAWPIIVAQCVLVAWLVRRTLVALGARVRGASFLLFMLALALGTALPWIAGQLMADVFAPALVLGLWLAMTEARLGRWERAGVLVLLAVCSSVHLMHLPLGALLWAALAWRLGRERRRLGARLFAPLAALLAGVMGIAGFNFARTGRPTLAGGGDAFLLAHLIESGLASAELNAHCPERAYLLCPDRGRLPISADEFLWVDRLDLEPFRHPDAIGREARRLLFDSLREHPLEHARVAVVSTLGALAAFRTGEGLDADARYLIEPLVKRYLPGELASYRAARQQRAALPIRGLRALHTPIAWMLLALGLWLAVSSPSRDAAHLDAAVGGFLRYCLLALATNAAISGNLSGVHDRYGARLVWLVAIGVFAAFWTERRAPSATTIG